jgi:hypothetical protein
MAEQGDRRGARGCGLLASLYARGEGVVKDEARAAELLGSACRGGEAFSCTELAHCYQAGKGVRQDSHEAARYLRLACDGGHAWGCRDLATSYAGGNGVPRDEATARAMAARAITLGERDCEGGSGAAPYDCSGVAAMYHLGQLVPRDMARARRFYKKACDGGVAHACQWIGENAPSPGQPGTQARPD